MKVVSDMSTASERSPDVASAVNPAVSAQVGRTAPWAPTAPVVRGGSLAGLLVAQFFGAFNDNAWNMMVALLAIRGLPKLTDVAAFEALAQKETTWAFVIFTLPFVFVSLPAGLLADRVSKRTLIVGLKLLEVVFMAAATITLYYTPAGGAAALVILALMGVQAALFSPAKYGIIPEIVPHERLSAGNGLLEMCSFIAIIGGTATGGLLLDKASAPWQAGLVLLAFSLFGFFASFFVPVVPAARSDGGMTETITTAWATIRADRVLYLAVLGEVFYWFIASLLGQDVLVYTKGLTQGWADSDTYSGMPLATFGIGVGFGSVIAGRISKTKVEYGLIPLGCLGIALITLLMGAGAPGYAWTLIGIALMGLASGAVVVPLNAILQWRSPADRRGGVIALANVFIFIGVLFGSLGTQALSSLGLTARQILVAASLFTVSGTVWAMYLLPDFLVRLVMVLMTHTFYRLKVIDDHHVPREGGALIAPNHVSFIDGFLIISSIDRPVRFIVDQKYYDHWLLWPLMRAMQVIPVAASGGMKVVLKALRDAGKYLDDGELVCIFAEGQVTRIGMLLPFRRGLERIVKGRNVPIIPVYLDRVWGSVFSRYRGRFITKLPERFPYPITVLFGKPLPSSTPIAEVRHAVQDLGATAWNLRKDERKPLHRRFISTVRRRPWRFCIGDATKPHVSRLAALTGAVAVARALREQWAGQTHVGIMLPSTVAGVVFNLAATIAGKVVVNLNFTTGAAGMTSMVRQAGLKTVVTSRAFVEKAKLELPEGATPIWAEEVGAGIGAGARLWAAVLALFAPITWLEAACGATRSAHYDDIATIIFSSGSTGEPKGVMLSHYNVDSNIEGVAQVLHIEPDDRMLGILPLFHSFGTMSTWYSLIYGMGVFFHPNPLDAVAIGDIVEQQDITFLIATPTFLQIYMRRCGPDQLGSLRIVITGAEKLSERLALAFADKFGIKPVEGYGATECAPVIALSTFDHREHGIFQAGSRRGFVGHPIPGIVVRTVDPETGAPIPPGQPGMLLVKGPNVMRGYLGRDDLTQKVLNDGWYTTGDVAIVDENGFIRITDRLSRFSKIGGEMVPHGKVEEALQEAAGADLQVFAVTGIPDEKKGEKLAVLTTLAEDKLPVVLEKMAGMGLPNLFIPRKGDFVKVDKLPVLGTGKIDLRAVKKTAIERLGTPETV